MSEESVCPGCGSVFKQLGSHWRMSSTCGYPELPDDKKLALKMMAAFGTYIDTDYHTGEYPTVRICRKERWKVELVAEILDWMAGSIQEREDGYMLEARRHPWLAQLRQEDYNNFHYAKNLPNIGASL